MLIDRFPPALLVYAHWLMMMILVEDLWWVDKMGRSGIQDVVAICSEVGFDVEGLLLWPQQMMEIQRAKTSSPESSSPLSLLFP